MRKHDAKNRIWLERAAAVLITLFAWQIAAEAIDSRLLFSAPTDVIKVLLSLLPESSFWATVGFSLMRIVTGFIAAFIVGTVLAALAGASHAIEVMLWPFLAVVSATPVVSFIILCLIWLNAENLSVCISFLMVMPVVYNNVLAGVAALDKKTDEMAQVFGIRPVDRLLYLELPQLRQFFLSAANVGMGLAWKSGISAEVIGIPTGSIGERLYQAKIYLSSEELFAWTVVMVLCSIFVSRCISFALDLFFDRLEAGR